jgi:hypothetical protein
MATFVSNHPVEDPPAVAAPSEMDGLTAPSEAAQSLQTTTENSTGGHAIEKPQSSETATEPSPIVVDSQTTEAVDCASENPAEPSSVAVSPAVDELTSSLVSITAVKSAEAPASITVTSQVVQDTNTGVTVAGSKSDLSMAQSSSEELLAAAGTSSVVSDEQNEDKVETEEEGPDNEEEGLEGEEVPVEEKEPLQAGNPLHEELVKEEVKPQDHVEL